MSYRKATIKAAAATKPPPMEAPSLEAAPVKAGRPVEVAERTKLADVLVAVPFEKVPRLVVTPELASALDLDLLSLDPVGNATAVVAATNAATPVDPDSVTVEKTTWGTVRMVEMMTVVDDPTIVRPSLTPAVAVAAWTMVVA